MEPTETPPDSTSELPNPELSEPPPPRRRSRTMLRLQANFLAGLVIAAPLVLTITISWWFVQWIDNLVDPFIPSFYRPDSYLRFSIPGFGLIVALIFITLLGFVARNYVGHQLVVWGESALARLPVVRGLYRGLKQIFETVISTRANAFQTVGLIEYPRRGTWAVVFLAGDAQGEVAHHINDTVAVFLPTTPNPTSGFLLFVKRSEITILDMSLEDAAKLVISGGLVTPDFAAPAAGTKPLTVKPVSPPEAA